MIERVTVIKFRMDNGGGNGAGCFEVEMWADTAKFTNVIVAGFKGVFVASNIKDLFDNTEAHKIIDFNKEIRFISNFNVFILMFICFYSSLIALILHS